MTEEFWLRNYSGCLCWIETGYLRELHGRGTPWMFWTQMNGTTEFADIASARYVGDADGSVGRFAVVLRDDGLFHIYVDTPRVAYRDSTANPMFDHERPPHGYVQMGMELQGGCCGAAPLVFFLGNRLFSLSPRLTEYFTAGQSRGGTGEMEDRPPYAGWLFPAAGDSNAGGVFFTQCCLPLSGNQASSVTTMGMTLPLIVGLGEADATPTPPPLLDETLFDRPATAPEGVPAVKVTSPGEVPAFDPADLARWMSETPMAKPYTGTVTDQPTVTCPVKASQADRLLPEATGLSSDRVLCIAKAQGTFTVQGPPDQSGQPSQSSATQAYVVVDATSGNLLIAGAYTPAM
jgi:hypothetical protein